MDTLIKGFTSFIRYEILEGDQLIPSAKQTFPPKAFTLVAATEEELVAKVAAIEELLEDLGN